MSEYATYQLIRSANERAESLDFEVFWNSDGWKLLNEEKHILITGQTAKELHQYLNGVEDGKKLARIEDHKTQKEISKVAEKVFIRLSNKHPTPDTTPGGTRLKKM